MSKANFFVYALTCCFAFPSQAEIITLTKMAEVKEKLGELTKSYDAPTILLALDIDMTLTQGEHPALYYPALKKYMDDYKEILTPLTSEQKDLVISLTSQVVPQRIVEEDTKEIIVSVQKLGIRTIAFTASLTGKIKGYHDKLIFLRKDQLAKLGLDFSKSLSDYSTVISFMDYPKYAGWYPMFYHGILSSNGQYGSGKAEVLLSFLDHIDRKYTGKTNKPGFQPKVIVFVDDRRKNLEEVEAALLKSYPDVKFIGVEYQGAYNYAPKEIKRDEFQKFWSKLVTKAKSKLPNKYT